MLALIDVFLISNQFMRGIVAGGGGVAILAAITFLVFQVTGTAARSMGPTAEQWTADELRTLRGNGWRLVNGFYLGGGDTDHVLVGPGGVVVVESKWSADGWDLTRSQARITDALGQVLANARRVRLWDPVKKSGLPVHPVLVLWGRRSSPQEPAGDHPVTMQGVTVLRGRSAVRFWCRETAAHAATVPIEMTDAVWHAIDRQVARRDQYERREHQAPPPSVERLTTLTLGALTAAIASAWLVSEAGSHLGSLWWLVVALALILVALPPLRWAGARVLAAGWIAGVIGTILTVCIVLVVRRP